MVATKVATIFMSAALPVYSYDLEPTITEKTEMHILITGAAGDVGGRLRKLLKGVYPRIRLSDIRKPANLAADEDFIAADLADYSQDRGMRSTKPISSAATTCSRRPTAPA
jgi:hypothetical protein